MRGTRAGSSYSYVTIDPNLCNGCVTCMRVCPTFAIRVRDGKLARVEGVCIDCGRCIRACPRGAIRSVTTEKFDFADTPHTVVSPSTVLYAQFGDKVTPNEILLGLKKLGFDHVHDQSYTSELFNIALELFIKEHREKGYPSWPLISPVCPAVLQLIKHRFPSLMTNIPPLATPREIVGREYKRRLSAKWGIRPEDVKVIHISPCPAKMTSINEPVLQHRSYLDAVIGICDIYEDLERAIRNLEEDVVLHHSGGIGLSWGMSGGETASLDLNCLAISGINETIRYLEKIEMGLLCDIDYVEFRICTEGCLGGPLNVTDKYLAKHHLQKQVRTYGLERRVKYEYVKNLYDKGWFYTDKQAMPLVKCVSQEELVKGIQRQNRVEEILEMLPRKECGLCGSPDCTAFAEDVADGRVSMGACVFMKERT